MLDLFKARGTGFQHQFSKLDCVSVPRCQQRGLQGSFCEERLGLPHAGHSQFQPVPAGSSGPTAGHSPAPQPSWGRLGETRFQQGPKAAQAEEEEGKEGAAAEGARGRRRRRRRRRRRAGGAAGPEQGSPAALERARWSREPPCSPGRAPRRSRGIFPAGAAAVESPGGSRLSLKDCSPGQGPRWSRETCEEGGRSGREGLGWTERNPHPHPLRPSGGEESGVKG